MGDFPPPVLQTGLPEIVPDLLGIAGTVVLLLIVIALAGVVYRSFTGGIDWPEDRDDAPTEADDRDDLEKGGRDDEWEYY